MDFVESNFYHYEFLGEHFKEVKGYDSYQQKAEIARQGGGIDRIPKIADLIPVITCAVAWHVWRDERHRISLVYCLPLPVLSQACSASGTDERRRRRVDGSVVR